MSELDHTEILEELEAITNWEVDEWEFKDGNDQPQSLTVELERREELDVLVTGNIEHSTTPKTVVGGIEEEYEEGAPIDLIVQTITDELDCDEDKAHKMIEKLRRKGEVYEPTEGVLRTT